MTVKEGEGEAQTAEQVEKERADAEAAFNSVQGDNEGVSGTITLKKEAQPAAKETAGDTGAGNDQANTSSTDSQGAASQDDAAAVEDDPWEGVPPAVRKMLEDINGKVGAVDALRRDVAANNGRVQKLSDQLANAALEATKDVKRAPTQAQIKEAQKSSAKWEQQKADFPEWADAMEERLAAEREAIAAQFPQQTAVDVDSIKNMVSNAVETSREEIEHRARQLARLDVKYPDWESDVLLEPARQGKPATYTPEFAAWYKAQPPEVKALAASPNAVDASAMLDKFYQHKRAVAARTQKKEQLVRAIPARGTGGQRQVTVSEREAEELAFRTA